jgi:maltose alpha-D-glucosyltransferase/alpha-amylase
MKLNLGIRRRLAPLLENSRDQMELFHAMLLSLPGTPIIYYGDDIGMGDNIYLGDRDGVRTPMHWSADRNAGFSRADFAQLYLPLLMDPVYGYERANVEAEERNPNSFLQWFRRLLAVRKQHPVFGFGSFEVLHPSSAAVFAYVRKYNDDIVLCVNNLAGRAQAAELDLSPYEGMYPVELLGRERFPRIGELPYLLTFGPHSFYWFQLVHEEES